MNGPSPVAVTGLTCLGCGASVPHGDVQTCVACGGVMDVHFDLARVRAAWGRDPLAGRPCDLWRYRELLPIAPGAQRPPLQVGWTPVFDAPRLAAALGVRALHVKDDGRNPTASLKDRASAVGVLKAIEFGYSTVACASTGNAASSLAGMAAAAGLGCAIFVPERAPEPKLTQLLVFGATVFKVRGTYEQAFDLCRAACARFGWYNRNSGTNPFLVEGKKTAGLEIAEQLGDRIPDWVVVSVGDGCTIGGIAKGLAAMHTLGVIPRMPRILGVQAEGARPLVDAFLTGRDPVPAPVHTLADSIAVGTPRNGRRALAAVRDSGGAMIAVPDDAILEAMRLTARLAGVFGEPAGVTGAAGLAAAVRAGVVKLSESALVIVTGNGLKDIAGARAAVGPEHEVAPDLAAVEAALRGSALAEAPG